MRTPTTQDTRGAGGAASVQSRNLAGQNLHSTPKTQKEAPPRPKLDHAQIDSLISPRELSKSWAPYGCREPFFLPLQPHIAIKSTAGQGVLNGGWHLEWFDPQTGVGGVGAVSLCAHVLRVSKDEAAWRIANWLALGRFAGKGWFWDTVTLQTEQVAT